MTEQLGHRVKQLEWVEDDEHAMGYRENAQSNNGVYWVEDHENSGEWRLYFDGYPQDCFLSGHDSEEAAKAAAQADCEHCVNSQLEPAPSVSEAALVNALRKAFPHFQNNERVTPEAISRIGAEWQDMVVHWTPFQTEITFSDQDGTTRHLEWLDGEPDVGCFSGYVMPEDAAWEVRALQQETGDE